MRWAQGHTLSKHICRTVRHARHNLTSSRPASPSSAMVAAESCCSEGLDPMGLRVWRVWCKCRRRRRRGVDGGKKFSQLIPQKPQLTAFGSGRCLVKLEPLHLHHVRTAHTALEYLPLSKRPWQRQRPRPCKRRAG